VSDVLAQHGGLVSTLIGVLALAALAFLLTRLRRRRSQEKAAAPSPERVAAVEPAPAKIDPAALMAAIEEAQAQGQQDRLPGLYLALASVRIEAGERAEAEDLLRKSIRGAGARHKETHARARVALGDLAKASGDLTTACEHWQIARALFHELQRVSEHEAVEQRMRANGCPTDWVLTDF
jgi:hypothetical protein